MKLVRNRSDNEPANGKSPASVKCRARLANILDGDRLAQIITNRRARIGLETDGISRFGPRRVGAPQLMNLAARRRKPARISR